MPRPKLLLFMPDQLRADAVGAFGGAARSEVRLVPQRGSVSGWRAARVLLLAWLLAIVSATPTAAEEDETERITVDALEVVAHEALSERLHEYTFRPPALTHAPSVRSSAERRVGKEGVRTCRYRVAPHTINKQNHI